MAPRRNERRDIQPTAPDETVRGLLALTYAQILPLAAGSRSAGYGETGDYILAAAVQGSLTVSAHSRYALLDAGQVILLESPGEYAVQAVSDGVCMLTRLRGELLPRLLGERLNNGSAIFLAGAGAVRAAVVSLAVLEEESGSADGVEASALAYTLLLKLRGLPLKGADSGKKPTASPLVERALAIIQEEFPFLEGVEELAQRLEVSAAHLSRVFTKKTGVSPGKYITHIRVGYAKLLLRDPESTITYVAEASGFANANYFSKVFRRETGMSPSEYLESVPRQPGERQANLDLSTGGGFPALGRRDPD